MPIQNAEIAAMFDQMADLLEIEGGNPFRARAYRKAARTIETLPQSVAALIAAEKDLSELPGIGKDLAGKIRDILGTGTTQTYEEMKKKYPLEVVELTRLQGLGPKRVRLLFETLHIRDRASLEKAARAGKLRELPGFGEKLEAKVLQSLAVAEQEGGRTLLAGVWPVAEALATVLEKVQGVRRVEIAGSFRRRRETVGDLDLLVVGGEPESVMDAFTTHAQVIEVLGRGETPRDGNPVQSFRVEYSRDRRPLGFLELGRAGAEWYARTEHTAGWVRLPPQGAGLREQAERLEAGVPLNPR